MSILQMVISKLSFILLVKEGIGMLTISGLPLEENRFYDALGKIWSSVRKRNAEHFGIQVSGIFMYDYPEKGKISCQFHPNCYNCNDDQEKIDEVINIFEQTFEAQIELFKEAIYLFITDEEFGLTAYLDHMAKIKAIADQDYEDQLTRQTAIRAAIKNCDSTFDEFLKKAELKTDADLERRQRKQEIISRELKHWAAIDSGMRANINH